MEIERLKEKSTLGHYPDLKNKLVVITGGNSGIGAGLSEAFLKEGARVIIISKDEQKGLDFCAAMQKDYNRQPIFFSCDLSDIEKLTLITQRIIDSYGAVDILINNAANDYRHTIEELEVEQWDNLMNINFRPFFFLAKAFVPRMKKKQKGCIINFSSNSQILGLNGYPAYVAAKGGIVALTKALARELGPDGIRVNCLIPGWVMTKRQKELWVTEKNLKECLDQQCLKETIELHHIASCALFLASNSSAMVTCQTLVVDAGRV